MSCMCMHVAFLALFLYNTETEPYQEQRVYKVLNGCLQLLKFLLEGFLIDSRVFAKVSLND